MSTYGIKVSQRGYPADTCADSQLLFNSEWPVLKIAKQGTFSVGGSTDSTIYVHNLGYPPIFMIFASNSYYSANNLGSMVGGSQFFGVNSTSLKYFGFTFSQPAGTFTGYYFILYYDLTSTYTAPTLITSQASQNIQTGFGLKATLPGYDANVETDYRNFSIHSDTRVPMLHMSAKYSGTGSPSTQVITHNLGYVPLTMVFFNDNRESITPKMGNWWQIPATTTDFSFYTADTTTVTLNLDVNTDVAATIFKDPFVS